MDVERRRRSVDAADAPEWVLHPAFEERLRARSWTARRVVDVGTGSGDPAFLLAKLGATVLGIDRKREALDRALVRSAEDPSHRVWFLEADAETLEYGTVFPGVDAVTAHLCVSEEIVRRAGRALAPGGPFLLCAHDSEGWLETGRPATYALSEARLAAILESAGFRIGAIVADRVVITYPSIEALETQRPHRVAKWKTDERWETLRRRFEDGERTVTEAYLIVDAVKA